MSKFNVIYDANVLYPFGTRDILIELATTELFRAKWTERIHHEWMTNLAHNLGIDESRLNPIRTAMDRSVMECLIEGYESLIPTFEAMPLPDPGDAHVIAAAVFARADMIVTRNLKDFPSEIIAPYNIEAQHPDEFILNQFDFNPSVVAASARNCRVRRKKPPLDAGEYIESLKKDGLPGTAQALQDYIELI